MKKALLALSMLIVLGTAFAQENAQMNAQFKQPLIINCNENNADVFINDQPVAKTARNLLIRLAPGMYSVRVSKAGFEDYINEQVSVRSQGGATLRISLRPAPIAPASAPIAPAPAVVAAPAPVIAPAPAPGGNMTMNASPAPAQAFAPAQASQGGSNRAFVGASFPLNVDSNVRGAQIYVNGQLIGQAPLGLQVSRGVYEIRVTAPGYQDFVQSLNVRSPEQVNAVLQSALAYWQLLVPETAAKGSGKEAIEQGGRRGMQLWVDGAPERNFTGQLTPGRHLLRLVAGDLTVERQVDVQAGRTYVFEPFLDINVR